MSADDNKSNHINRIYDNFADLEIIFLYPSDICPIAYHIPSDTQTGRNNLPIETNGRAFFWTL